MMMEEFTGFFEDITTLLKKDEGRSLKMYKDTQDVWTIGYGHNLEEGISAACAEFILKEDILLAFQELDRHKPFWRQLPWKAKLVVASMQYNLGWPRFSKFVKFWRALEQGNFILAAHEMEDSQWYTQVGQRGPRLKQMMETIDLV